MHRTHNPTAPAADTADRSVVTPADILRGAAHYLETHGWQRGDYYADDTPFPSACAMGAIGMAAHGTRLAVPTHCAAPAAREFRLAFHCLIGYLADLGAIAPHGDDEWGTDPTTVYDWNDYDDPSAANVIATLRAAADDYDWQHATENDLETYADACAWREEHPTRDGFLAWRGAR